MSGRARDRYEDVGRAVRASAQRVIAARCTQKEQRLWLAIAIRVWSWSRLADYVALGELADEALLDRRDAQRGARRLLELGAIVYEPGLGGRGRRALVGVPETEGGSARPSSGERAGDSTLETAGGSALERVGGSARPYEKAYEKTSENGNGNRPWLPLHPSRYTGCRWTRGETSGMHVYDPLGTDRPPDGWPHPKPSIEDVAAALRDGSST